MDLEKIGEVSELLNDMSPLQVGTTGTYQGKAFRLLGRIKVGYKGGMWSEWYVLFDDMRQGWLARAQGLYMMSFQQENVPIPPYKQTRIGQKVKFEGVDFVVDDRKEITYLGSEGELPYVFKQGYKGRSIDLRGPDGKFLNFLYGPQGSDAFLGSYQDFNSFDFNELRVLNGWS